MAEDASWDSLALIGTIVLVDRVFGITLDGEALEKVGTFGELKALIQSFYKQAA